MDKTKKLLQIFCEVFSNKLCFKARKNKEKYQKHHIKF